MPLLMAGWYVAYIDRFNVGYAALEMNADLGLSAGAFGFGAGIFFLAYSIFELPSNLALAKVGARVWLTRIMITWGVAAIAMATVTDAWSFYGLRFLLGMAEAGCFPGMAYYLSQHLPLRERTIALAQLGVMTQLAAITGGPLAAMFLGFDGFAGLSGWQWLFIGEGLPAILLGLAVYRFLPDNLQDVGALSTEERRALAVTTSQSAPISLTDTLRFVFTERRYLAWADVFFCYNVGSSAVKMWQPTILRSLSPGASLLSIGLLTSIPAIVGGLAILAVGWSSRHFSERRWHVTLPLLAGASGLLLLSISTTTFAAVCSAALVFAAVACQPPLFAAVTAVSEGSTKAAGVAYVNSLAMLGSFFGPTIVGIVSELGLGTSAYAAFGTLWAGAALFNLTIDRPQRRSVFVPMVVEKT